MHSGVGIVPEKRKSILDELVDGIDEDPAFKKVMRKGDARDGATAKGASVEKATCLGNLRFVPCDEAVLLLNQIRGSSISNASATEQVVNKVFHRSVVPRRGLMINRADTLLSEGSAAASFAMAFAQYALDGQVDKDQFNEYFSGGLEISDLTINTGTEYWLRRAGVKNGEENVAYVFDNVLLALLLRGQFDLTRSLNIHKGIMWCKYNGQNAMPELGDRGWKGACIAKSAEGKDWWGMLPAEDNCSAAAFMLYDAVCGDADAALKYARRLTNERGVRLDSGKDSLVVMKNSAEGGVRLRNIDLCATATMALAHFALGNPQEVIEGRLYMNGLRQSMVEIGGDVKLFQEYVGDGTWAFMTATNAMIAAAFMAEKGCESSIVRVL